ncbi:hypothetical protein FRC03_001171 [Tulasnella sp. 419]|nr:hypothetical protein FRC03_001171 [Tulasnella sp. 419]
MSSSRHRHSSNISGDTLLSRISYRSGSPVRNSITQLGSFPHSLTSSVDDNEVPVMTNDYLVPNEPPESIPRSILKGSSLAGVGTINSDSEPVFNPDCDGPNEVMLQASSDPALLARISGANTPPPPGNKAIGMRAQQHASVSDFKLASTSGIQPPPTAPVTSSAVSFSTFRFSSSFKNDIPKQSSRQTHSHHEVVNSPASTLLTRIEGIQKSKSSFTSSATGPPSPPTEGGQARSELRINSVQGAIPGSSNLFSRTEKLGPSDSSAMELKASSESERNGTLLITQKSGSAKPNARFEVTAVASGLSSVTYPPNPLLGQTLSTDTSIRSRLSQVETLLQRETEKNTMLQDLFKIENEKNAKLHELVTSLTGALAEERGKREAVENELRKIQDRNRSLEVSKDVLHKVKSLIEDATCQ